MDKQYYLDRMRYLKNELVVCETKLKEIENYKMNELDEFMAKNGFELDVKDFLQRKIYKNHNHIQFFITESDKNVSFNIINFTICTKKDLREINEMFEQNEKLKKEIKSFLEKGTEK